MRYKILDQNGLNFLTFTVVEWIDLFSRRVYKDIIIDSLRHCQQEKGLVVCGYVIMSNHVHAILHTEEPAGLSWIIQLYREPDPEIHQGQRESGKPAGLAAQPLCLQCPKEQDTQPAPNLAER